MKSVLCLAILCLLFRLSVSAQEIRGQVINERGEALAYANAVVVNKADSSFIVGAVTSDEGWFKLSDTSKTPWDQCLVRISCIGYRTVYLMPQDDMGSIVLKEEAQSLNEVVVSAKPPLIQMNRGKIQVNVEHTLLARVGDAVQVLSMMPFVDGNKEGISVFGRGKPLIYIDNLKTNDIGDLQKLAADEIKRVEIDLHPGTSYGTDVRAVIRISTIRKGEGLSVNLTAQGTWMKHSAYYGLGKLNYRYRQWDFFGGIDYRDGRKENSTGDHLSFEHKDSAIDVDQSFDNDSHYKTLNAHAGINFYNKEKNDFGMKYNFSRTPSSKNEMSGTSTYAEGNGAAESDEVTLLGRAQKTNHAVNAYYITSWGKENRLTVNVDYLHGKMLTDYETFWTAHKDMDSKSLSKHDLYAGKVEVANPVLGGELTYGTELSLTKNNYSYSANETINTALSESKDENHQNLWALFVSQTMEVGDFSLEAGGRFEMADYKYYHDDVLNQQVSKTYKKLLPYAQIDYDKGDVSMSLSFSNSIHRPSYGALNGSRVYIDKYTYQQGNPMLLSAYDYVLDLVFSWKGLTIDLTHTWYENSLMSTVRKMEDAAAVMFTTENIPHYREWGVVVSYSSEIKFWRPKAELSVFKQQLTYEGQRYNDPSFNYELDNVFRLSKHVSLTFDMWGQAAGTLYLTEFKPNFRADLGLSAYLLKNKLAVWVKLTDLFNTDREWWTDKVNNLIYAKSRSLDTRGVMLQLRYTINPQRSKYKGTTTSSEVTRF